MWSQLLLPIIVTSLVSFGVGGAINALVFYGMTRATMQSLQEGVGEAKAIARSAHERIDNIYANRPT